MKSRINPAQNSEDLKRRVDRFFKGQSAGSRHRKQLELFSELPDQFNPTILPTSSPREFLDFFQAALPQSDIYLFGGILRDLALFGRKGFNSDIDLVVDGEIDGARNYLAHIGAKRNKFGGYRLIIGGWEIDVWQASETWAFRKKILKYQGIDSLLQSTITNWDAILMNWRTKAILCSSCYFSDLKNRRMELILAENPDKLGMLVKMLRYLLIKDTKTISESLQNYILDEIKRFPFNQIEKREASSFGENYISRTFLRNVTDALQSDTFVQDLSSEIYERRVL